MISEIIEKWIKGILIDGITGNLSGLFDNVNAKVGEIASDVGSTPQAWNSGIFNMLRSLSETVVLPIAAAILGGGAALYYFKFRKPKADTTGHDDLDEYDFGEDEDADEEPAEMEELIQH